MAYGRGDLRKIQISKFKRNFSAIREKNMKSQFGTVQVLHKHDFDRFRPPPPS